MNSNEVLLETFANALFNRLCCEYQNIDYRGSFEDYCGSRMPEIMDILIPSIPVNTTSFDKDHEVKEAFENWFHNKFRFDHSNEKTNMLQAWRAAEEVYNLKL